MMQDVITKDDNLATARQHTLEAARILRLLRFQVRCDLPGFSACISSYADMLDPMSGDAARLRACRRYLEPVRERIVGEKLKAPLARPTEFESPYGLEAQTTPQGMLLMICERHLSAAICAFEAALKRHDRAE